MTPLRQQMIEDMQLRDSRQERRRLTRETGNKLFRRLSLCQMAQSKPSIFLVRSR